MTIRRRSTKGRAASPAVTNSQKIIQGPSGFVPQGYQAHTHSPAGNHVTVLITPAHGRLFRGGGSRADFTTLDANVISNIDSAASAGYEYLPGLYVSVDAYDTSTVGGTYTSAVLATTLAHFPALRFCAIRNEPAFVGTQDVDEQAWAYPAIKAAVPGVMVCGPIMTGVGFTPNRTTVLPTYISQGGLSTIDVFDFHVYGNGPGVGGAGPEFNWQQQVCYVVNRVLGVNPSMKFGISEYGWDTGASSSTAFRVTQAQQNYFISRGMFIYRCIPNIQYVSLYADRDDGVGSGEFGVHTGTNVAKASRAYAIDTADHVHAFTLAAAYTRSNVTLLSHQSGAWASSEDLIGGNTGYACPWFVDGTVSGGSHRLAAWYAFNTTTTYGENVYVTAVNGATLNIQTIGGSTVQTTIQPGTTLLPITLTETPKVIYSTDETNNKITFPEFG